MKGGKKKSAGGVSGSSNFDPTNESQPDNAAAYGDFEEMPVSDAAAALEEYNQEQQQRQRRLEKGKELLLQNEEDFIEEYEYYEDVERSMYDRFNHLEISQDSDGQAVGGDGDGDGGNEEEVADERPKLAEGFYEIEAVRKKRTRKGVAQYLIKWRGWPETANTWEPLVNLQSCSDVIEAFEESLQLSGKGKAGRKRKRKHGVTPQPQSKKKPQQQQQSQHRKKGARSYNNLPAVMVTLNEESLAPPPSAPMTVSLNAVEETNVDGAVNSNSGETAKQGDENKNGTEVISSPQVEERRETDLSEPIGSRFGDDPDHNEGAAQTNGVVPSVDGNEAGQSGRRVGARRRKSGAVKRLNVESSSSHPVDDGQVAPPIRMGSTNGIQNGGLGSNRSDTHVITEIIKAIDYSRPTSDTTTQEVAVTFMAKRSDGTEVVVTNKYLKAHFPLLDALNHAVEEFPEEERNSPSKREKIFTYDLGKDSHGRLRCMGLGLTKSRVFGKASSAEIAASVRADLERQMELQKMAMEAEFSRCLEAQKEANDAEIARLLEAQKEASGAELARRLEAQKVASDADLSRRLETFQRNLIQQLKDANAGIVFPTI